MYNSTSEFKEARKGDCCDSLQLIIQTENVLNQVFNYAYINSLSDEEFFYQGGRLRSEVTRYTLSVGINPRKLKFQIKIWELL